MAMIEQEGRILRSVAGFYYVETGDTILECRAIGLFRKQKMKPVPGDLCIVRQENEDEMPMVAEILPRKNLLVRPPIANLDRLYIVVSMTEPAPNLGVIDRLLVTAESHDIPVSLILTKIDLEEIPSIEVTYHQLAKYPVFTVDYEKPETIEAIEKNLTGKFTAFCGNSGAGKSTLLNAIAPEIQAETAPISDKLGRGKHTTREVRIYRLNEDTLVADTPGFSSIEMSDTAKIAPEELAQCFPEFRPFLGECKFRDCVHVGEVGCAVEEAVEAGEIAQSRYQNYLELYKEAKSKNAWEES